MNQIVKETPVADTVEDLASPVVIALPEGQTLLGMLPHNGRVDIGCTDVISVIAWIEASRREDGTVAIYDEIGKFEGWAELKDRPGSWRGTGKKLHEFLVAGEFMVATGHGPAGRQQRIVLKGACSWSTVKIRNGVPTIGANWVPNDYDFKSARDTFKKELAERKIDLKPLLVPEVEKPE